RRCSVDRDVPANISAAVAVANAGYVVLDQSAIGKHLLRRLRHAVGWVEASGAFFIVVVIIYFCVSLAAIFAIHWRVRGVLEQLEHRRAKCHYLLWRHLEFTVTQTHGHCTHLLQRARAD